MIVIADCKNWARDFGDRLQTLLPNEDIEFISSKDAVTIDRLLALNPRYIFFPHWSYIIPEAIYDTFECVIFHMTDLPFGRGGSPLQNIISRGIKKTKLSAFQCVKELDAGPLYLKRDLALDGKASDIYNRAYEIILDMICAIVRTTPKPTPQSGPVTNFSRRTPADSNILTASTLEGIYDTIRMLDAEGYPLAFLDSEHFRLEFSNAKLNDTMIEANVTIRMKNK